MNSHLEIESILSELASRVDGAVDYWTTLCFLPADMAYDFPAFVEQQSKVFSDLLERLNGCIQCEQPNRDRVVTHTISLPLSLAQFSEAFLTIADHRNCPVDVTNNAITQLADAYTSLTQTFLGICGNCGIELSYWNRRTPERAGYYQQILSNLPQRTQESRQSGSVPATLQMPDTQFQEIGDAIRDAADPIDTDPFSGPNQRPQDVE